MGKTLTQIAQELKDSTKKVQLIYAFNGTGKTRLSRKFKELCDYIYFSTTFDEAESLEEFEEIMEGDKRKILYYNAFTEDLFYWKNYDKLLRIHANDFTRWIFEEQGVESYVIDNFQKYVGKSITPVFNDDFDEISFLHKDIDGSNVKISKGEESCFIWSVFYTILKEVILVLNEVDETNRSTTDFDKLEYIFIDDPVSSMDENHLIQLAVDLAQLIRKSEYTVNRLRFVITTHNPLFYNVLYNELSIKKGAMLTKSEDGTYVLDDKFGDSNKTFSYHHYLIDTIKQAIDNNKIEKYHFTLLRNLYEKAANFLGYKKWSELLPDDKELYSSRIMNFYSHRTLTYEEIKELTEPEKQTVKFLFNHLIDNSKFWKEEQQ